MLFCVGGGGGCQENKQKHYFILGREALLDLITDPFWTKTQICSEIECTLSHSGAISEFVIVSEAWDVVQLSL